MCGECGFGRNLLLIWAVEVVGIISAEVRHLLLSRIGVFFFWNMSHLLEFIQVWSSICVKVSFVLCPTIDRLALHISESFHTGTQALTTASTQLVIFSDRGYINMET